MIGAVSALWWSVPGGVAATLPATPDVDSDVACNVTPRSREAITALVADPAIATPAATTSGQTLPEGTPVSAETANAIERIVRAWLACQNAGEPLRAWALFSDGYLHRLLSRQGFPIAIDASIATPAPEATGGATLLDIRSERELPDGRLGATIVIAYPAVPMPKTFFFYFTEIGDRLLIDGILGEISFAVP